jgi:hypothetical protein
MKTCTDCNQLKSFNEFNPHRAKCKLCLNKQHREYCKRNRPVISRIIRKRLLKKYGLTLESFDVILRAQGYQCAICRSSDPKNKFNVFVVDHDHKTNQVRGLLCTHCNAVLGMLEKNLNMIPRVKMYLEYNLSTKTHQ